MIKRFIPASGDSFETGEFTHLSPITREGVSVQEGQTLQPPLLPTLREWDRQGLVAAKAAPVPGQRALSLHTATAATPVLPPCSWLVSATAAS